MGVPANDLDDLCQDVLLTVYRRQGDFEGRSKWSTWIYGIALRRCQNHRRLTQRRRTLPLEADVSSTEDLERRAAHQQELGRVLEFLDEFHLGQRQAFVLCALEGVSPAEAAGLLGVPVNTVYSRLRLAREHLNRHLYGDEDGE